jgi:hypothetical protein
MNMPTHRFHAAFRVFAGTTLLAALLAGCGRSATPEAVPAPPPASSEAPAAPPPADELPPAGPTDSPAGPAQPTQPTQPAPAAPPPHEPDPAPARAAIESPALGTMSAAQASAKISVPVDLRYQFDGPVLPDQPVTLHLAAVPRVAGSRLTVTINPVSGLRLDALPLSVQKASAEGVYRQQVSVTAAAGAPAELRVMVTMDMDQGKAFGFFTVPLAGGTAAQKQNSVKQR